MIKREKPSYFSKEEGSSLEHLKRSLANQSDSNHLVNTVVECRKGLECIRTSFRLVVELKDILYSSLSKTF
jgi:hypothetical protein